MESKRVRGVTGSLALRVLLTSFAFVITPLIFYSLVLYKRDYQRKVESVLEEMALLEENNLDYIREIEHFSNNFLKVVDELAKMIKPSEASDEVSDRKITQILQEFSSEEKISSIFYLERQPDGRLICRDSTLPGYKGLDLTAYIDIKQLEMNDQRVFIQDDPVLDKSLYVVRAVYERGTTDLVGVLVATMAIDTLIDQMVKHQVLYKANITILSNDYRAIASSNDNLKTIIFSGKAEEGVGLQRIPKTKRGYTFNFLDEQRVGVLAMIPRTDDWLLMSLPNRILFAEMKEYLWHLAYFLIIILIIGGVMSYLVTLRMARPLRQLMQVMTDVEEGDLQSHFHQDRIGFEINALGGKFNHMLDALITHMEEAARERSSKEAYAREIEIGHQIQQSILPPRDAHLPGVDIITHFAAAREVAGDFYDWRARDHQVFITVADAVNKGISSCLYAFDLRSMLRSFSTTESGLDAIVLKANNLFCLDTGDTGSFVTAFVALYDTMTHELQYANCGHMLPLIKHASGAISRPPAVKGMAFGVDSWSQVLLATYQLIAGDRLIFYTDGITEAQNSHQELFGEHRLEQLIASSTATTPELLLEEILSTIATFVDGAPQFDDMTLLILTPTF